MNFFNKLNNKNKLTFWSIVIGNSLDHYDSALYAFLAPFLAPIFFPNSDPLVGIILVYGIKSAGFFTRPLGAIFFGNLARRYSAKNLLVITLSGVSISTLCMGLIPSYNSIGVLAPILLAIFRSIQGFFAAGEHNIASLCILDYVKEKKRHSRSSSYYLVSTMMGSFLASGAAWLVSTSSDVSFYWRVAFIAGVITGIFGLMLRYLINEPNILPPKVNSNLSSIKLLGKHKWKILKIIPIYSLTFVTYAVPFIFLNNIAPHVTETSISDIMMYNTLLVAFNNCLIPVFGHIAEKFSLPIWLASATGILSIITIPLFSIIPYLGLTGIIIAKIVIIILGVAFVAPLNAFLYQIISSEEKYLISGFSYAIGTELLGRNTTVVCLSLFYWQNNLIAPAFYISSVALLATICLLTERKNFSAQKAT